MDEPYVPTARSNHFSPPSASLKSTNSEASSSSDDSSTSTATASHPTLTDAAGALPAPTQMQNPPPALGANDDAIEAAIRAAIISSESSAMSTAPPAGSCDGRTIPPRDTRTQLFVGNLPYRVRWQDLKDLFRRSATVLRADVALGSDNRSRGYGTVLLGTAEDAGRAVDVFNGYEWQGRVLEVRIDRGGPLVGGPYEGTVVQPSLMNPQEVMGGFSQFEQQPYGSVVGQGQPANPPSIPGRTLFVGNLPYHVQWQDLKDLFRRTPGGVTVLRADVALGVDGRSKGFGTVTLRTEEEAERAKRWFSGYEFNGRQLKVHHDRVTPSTTVSTSSMGPPTSSSSSTQGFLHLHQPYPLSSSSTSTSLLPAYLTSGIPTGSASLYGQRSPQYHYEQQQYASSSMYQQAPRQEIQGRTGTPSSSSLLAKQMMMMGPSTASGTTMHLQRVDDDRGEYDDVDSFQDYQHQKQRLKDRLYPPSLRGTATTISSAGAGASSPSPSPSLSASASSSGRQQRRAITRQVPVPLPVIPRATARLRSESVLTSSSSSSASVSVSSTPGGQYAAVGYASGSGRRGGATHMHTHTSETVRSLSSPLLREWQQQQQAAARVDDEAGGFEYGYGYGIRDIRGDDGDDNVSLVEQGRGAGEEGDRGEGGRRVGQGKGGSMGEGVYVYDGVGDAQRQEQLYRLLHGQREKAMGSSSSSPSRAQQQHQQLEEERTSSRSGRVGRVEGGKGATGLTGSLPTSLSVSSSASSSVAGGIGSSAPASTSAGASSRSLPLGLGQRTTSSLYHHHQQGRPQHHSNPHSQYLGHASDDALSSSSSPVTQDFSKSGSVVRLGGARSHSVVSTTGSTTSASESGLSTSLSGSSRTGSSAPGPSSGASASGSGSGAAAADDAAGESGRQKERERERVRPGSITLPPPPQVVFPVGGAPHAAASAAHAAALPSSSSSSRSKMRSELLETTIGAALFQQHHPFARGEGGDGGKGDGGGEDDHVEFEHSGVPTVRGGDNVAAAPVAVAPKKTRRKSSASSAGSERAQGVQQWSDDQAYLHQQHQHQQHMHHHHHHQQYPLTPMQQQHNQAMASQLTPHGLPPMTPSMPPFTFVPMHATPFASPGLYPPTNAVPFRQRRPAGDGRVMQHRISPGTLSLPPQHIAFAQLQQQNYHQHSPPVLSPASTVGPGGGGTGGGAPANPMTLMPAPSGPQMSYLHPLGSPGSPYALGPHHPLHHAHQYGAMGAVYGHAVPHPLSQAMSPGAPWGRPPGWGAQPQRQQQGEVEGGPMAGEVGGGHWEYGGSPEMVEPKGYFDQLYMSPSAYHQYAGVGALKDQREVVDGAGPSAVVEREILKDRVADGGGGGGGGEEKEERKERPVMEKTGSSSGLSSTVSGISTMDGEASLGTAQGSTDTLPTSEEGEGDDVQEDRVSQGDNVASGKTGVSVVSDQQEVVAVRSDPSIGAEKTAQAERSVLQDTL